MLNWKESLIDNLKQNPNLKSNMI